ncbi:uncharacterized protein LOC118437122 [Folsomia candida]|nr:uncharacterized protein LOC118437122 [Folsomia candida]
MVTIFIILLVSVVQNSGAISSSTIRIQAKTEKGSEEKFVEYDPTKCNPSIPNAPDGRFRYIQTNGNCANVYEEKNCSGFFARLESAEVAFSVFSPDTSLWWGNNFVETTFKVKSVGPCWEKCDGRNWDNVDYANYNVTVGLGDKVTGNQTMLDVSSDACISIPVQRENLDWIKIYENQSSCIELHDEVNCSGKSVILRPGYPDLHHLAVWTRKAKSISRCGAFCNKLTPEVNPIPLGDELRDNMVTVFDHPGLYGTAINLNLTEGCTTLDQDIPHFSIQTYGQCVVLFDHPHCTDRPGYSYQTGRKEGEYYVQKQVMGIYPKVLRSIRLCGDDEEAEIYLVFGANVSQVFVWKMTSLALFVVLVVVLAGVVFVFLSCKRVTIRDDSRYEEQSSVTYATESQF